MYIFLNTPYGWKYKVLVACAEIHCLCQCLCMTSSCLYCDHGQSIKARRRYWQGIWSTVCFTLPLFVCVFVWVLVQASVSSHFLPAIVCMCVCHSFSFSNQCLIGLIPKTLDELFLEIPVMKRSSTPPKRHNSSVYIAMKKYFRPSRFLSFLCIWHTYVFQIIKLILILDKDNASKYRMSFSND